MKKIANRMSSQSVSEKILALFILVFLGLSLEAQVVEKHKQVIKSFPVTKETNIQVTNKYGNIHIVPWDKDSVKFETDIRASDKKEEVVDLFLANIDFEFTGTPYYVIAKTEFRDFRRSIWANISDMASTFMNVDYGVEINWMIYVPSYCNLKLDNKFGNIYMSDHSGTLDLTLSNGDLKANNLTGETKIALEFGNGNVNGISNGKLIINYSWFDFKDIKKATLESKSSEINITFANELNLNSRRDKYTIDSLNVLTGESNFSNLTVRKIEKEINVTMKYTSLKASEISYNFKTLNLTSNYSDVDLTLNKDADYNIAIKYYKSEVVFPENIPSVTSSLVSKETGEYLLAGVIGQPDKARDVKINAIAGKIIISLK